MNLKLDQNFAIRYAETNKMPPIYLGDFVGLNNISKAEMNITGVERSTVFFTFKICDVVPLNHTLLNRISVLKGYISDHQETGDTAKILILMVQIIFAKNKL
jgi:hypothetical protein